MFFAFPTFIASPTGLDFDCLRVSVHAECDAEGRRYERLTGGRIDFTRAFFRIYLPGSASKLLDLVGFDALSLRREFADQITVAHTHIHDLLERAVRRAEDVVHHGELQQFAEIGLLRWVIASK